MLGQKGFGVLSSSVGLNVSHQQCPLVGTRASEPVGQPGPCATLLGGRSPLPPAGPSFAWEVPGFF